MKIQEVVKCLFLGRVVGEQEFFHPALDLIGACRKHIPDGIWQFFVFPHGEPCLPRVRCAVFEGAMQFLDERLRDRPMCILDDEIDTFEMICRFYDVVHTHIAVAEADRVGLKYESRLVMREAAALDVVGVVCEFDLNFMVNAARKFRFHLGGEDLRQRRGALLVDTDRFLRVKGDIPCLSRQKCAVDLAESTVIANAPLGQTPFSCRLGNREILHRSPQLVL